VVIVVSFVEKPMLFNIGEDSGKFPLIGIGGLQQGGFFR